MVVEPTVTLVLLDPPETPKIPPTYISPLFWAKIAPHVIAAAANVTISLFIFIFIFA